MSNGSMNLSNVLKQARVSVLNMGAVCDILQRLATRNREIQDELKLMAERLKKQVEINKQLHERWALSEKERIKQANKTQVVINDEDGKIAKLQTKINQQIQEANKATLELDKAHEDVKRLQAIDKIEKEQIEALREHIKNDNADMQQSKVSRDVKENNERQQREDLIQQNARLQEQLREKDMDLQQAKLKVSINDRKEKELLKLNNDNVKKILQGGLKPQSNIKF
tara:strand:+ start:249 stop:926 length:678 start_codon:yes stop_codon:yes gene_type:complete